MSDTPPPTAPQPDPHNAPILALLSDARSTIASLELKIEELTEETTRQTTKIETLSNRFSVVAIILTIIFATSIFFFYNELNTIEDMIPLTQTPDQPQAE